MNQNQARVLLATEGAPARARIEADLRDAATLVEATEARAYAPWVNVSRAELACVVGDAVGRQRTGCSLRSAPRSALQRSRGSSADEVLRVRP
jgi:hypothetical protein